mmetsp:Transcript_5491/g.9798  ORF Transcript_5491/g.9798 Transcript_5491/m.9798 type:complete len:331 (-) Transcript_5491:477-1469(-)
MEIAPAFVVMRVVPLPASTMNIIATFPHHVKTAPPRITVQRYLVLPDARTLKWFAQKVMVAITALRQKLGVPCPVQPISTYAMHQPLAMAAQQQIIARIARVLWCARLLNSPAHKITDFRSACRWNKDAQWIAPMAFTNAIYLQPVTVAWVGIIACQLLVLQFAPPTKPRAQSQTAATSALPWQKDALLCVNLVKTSVEALMHLWKIPLGALNRPALNFALKRKSNVQTQMAVTSAHSKVRAALCSAQKEKTSAMRLLQKKVALASIGAHLSPALCCAGTTRSHAQVRTVQSHAMQNPKAALWNAQRKSRLAERNLHVKAALQQIGAPTR